MSAVPHIEGLTVEEFLQYMSTKPSILKYMPDERDWLHYDRKWICDVLYTLDTENFQALINDAIARRRKHLEESQDLLVQMRPEFVEALNGSLQFSSR